MENSRSSGYGWRRISWLGVVIVGLAALWRGAIAQAPTPPFALFQQAVLTGSGNTINATQVPVVTSTGAVVYLNLTLQFSVDASGNLSLASGYPQISKAPTLLASGFRAGTYVGPSNVLGGKAIINVTGPGVTDGGATMWSLSTATGANSGTYPASATWYVGPIANNPNGARITAAGITSTAFSYGTSVGWGCQNSLIGASQVGNTLSLVNYSNCSDAATPHDQITYTLVPTP